MLILALLINIIFKFVAILVASKITKFPIYKQHIAIICIVSSLLMLIPAIGWILSLISIFILIKYFSNDDDIFFMVGISWVVSMIIKFGLSSILIKL